MITRQQKEEIVDSLRDKINSSQAVFLTNLIGVDANTSVKIRKEIREANGSIVVTRNTLFRKAAEGTNVEKLLSNLKGANAVAFAFEDAPGVAKAIYEANKENESVELKGGFLGEQELSKEQFVNLAKLPSRDEMLGKLLATFNAPLSAFVRVLDAVKQQKEEGAEPAPAEA